MNSKNIDLLCIDVFKLLLLLRTLMSKNVRELSFSIRHVFLILVCLERTYVNKVLTWFSDFSTTKISST